MSAPADLVSLAREMMSKAYAPYSNFAVGAAVRADSGRIYGGCNVENAAFPQGCCAEASAISAMVAGGDRCIAEVTVMAQGNELVTPCGGCRQRLREFARDDIPLHLCTPDGQSKMVTLGELLPLSFGPAHLSR